MIIRRIRSIPSISWLLLFGMLGIGLLSIATRQYGVISGAQFFFIVQPILTIGLALLAYLFMGGKKYRLLHDNERAVIIASIVAIWFVVYFLSGLFVTFVRNSLISDITSIFINVFAFGASAIAVEYVRHHTVLSAGKRNAYWYGAIVSIIFALQYVNIAQLPDIKNVEDIIKIIATDIVPALTTSMLLTYLAVTSGILSQMTYRLGLVAASIFPPIIPKYDWYMTSVTLILLAVAIYVLIDRSTQGRHDSTRHYTRHVHRSYDAMIYMTIIALACFMVGIFTYKPMAIMSNSMHPIFSRGAIVVVQKTKNPMDIAVGDIVQYEAGNKMVTHRVVAIDLNDDGSGQRVFITKGDNSPSRDEPVQPKQIVGIVRASIPNIGYPTVWLREVIR